jgi:colanic acid biosynthesis glycosyl transferase WcaI
VVSHVKNDLMSGKVVIVTQHYRPDPSTTAGIMTEIAEHLAQGREVLVLSGTPGSARENTGRAGVQELRRRMTVKADLIKRGFAEFSFAIRALIAVLKVARRGDVVLTVTAPFILPYAVVLAARLKGARSALIMHDLYPDVLVMAGLLRPASLPVVVLRAANALMFHWLSAVITIGRDTERMLLKHRQLGPGKVHFIPNWTTLEPGVRPVDAANPVFPRQAAAFVVGLSGNLGFTHDPSVVFEAARLLQDRTHIHFLLSGWGVGFETLRKLQAEAKLANVTLVDRVVDGQLENLLSAADIWVIPYRKNVAGVSVPSRFYNLLAVGRPVILVTEPEAEAALTVAESRIGFVVPPEAPRELSTTIQMASESSDPSLAERAVGVAKQYSLDRAMASYGALVNELLKPSKRGAISS